MILDKLAELADGMAIAGTAATGYPAAYSYDKGAAANDIGAGEELYLVVQIDTQVVAAGGAANVTFAVVDDDAATLASPATLLASAAIPKATLAPGYQIAFRIPKSTQRYIGLLFTPDTNDTTGGTFSAFITKVVPENVNYPSGFSVA